MHQGIDLLSMALGQPRRPRGGSKQESRGIRCNNNIIINLIRFLPSGGQPAISYGSRKPFQERNLCRPTEQKLEIYLATLASSFSTSSLEVARFLKNRNHELRFLLPEELWIGKSELESRFLGIRIVPPLVGIDAEVTASKIFPFPVTQASLGRAAYLCICWDLPKNDLTTGNTLQLQQFKWNMEDIIINLKAQFQISWHQTVMLWTWSPWYILLQTYGLFNNTVHHSQHHRWRHR